MTTFGGRLTFGGVERGASAEGEFGLGGRKLGEARRRMGERSILSVVGGALWLPGHLLRFGVAEGEG